MEFLYFPHIKIKVRHRQFKISSFFCSRLQRKYLIDQVSCRLWIECNSYGCTPKNANKLEIHVNSHKREKYAVTHRVKSGEWKRFRKLFLNVWKIQLFNYNLSYKFVNKVQLKLFKMKVFNKFLRIKLILNINQYFYYFLSKSQINVRKRKKNSEFYKTVN